MLDIFNGIFELCGAPFVLLSIVKLHREKVVKGVSFYAVAYFTAWGIWNLYYYPQLDQWWSFAGGIALVVVNGIWVGQMIYYGRKTKQRTTNGH